MFKAKILLSTQRLTGKSPESQEDLREIALGAEDDFEELDESDGPSTSSDFTPRSDVFEEDVTEDEVTEQKED